MKKIKVLCAALLATMALGASAQSTSGTEKDCTPYSRVYVSFNPNTIKYDFDGDDDESEKLTGFSVGYLYGISLTQKLPLFLEVGGRFNYSFKKESIAEYEGYDDDDFNTDFGDFKLKYASIAAPINLAYKFTTAGGKLDITPFVGVTAKFNLLAQSSANLTDEGENYVDEEYYKANFFDKDDVGKDGQWSRFQMGWQIGAGVTYNKFYLGLHYGGDFGEIAEDTKTSNWGLSLGYSF